MPNFEDVRRAIKASQEFLESAYGNDVTDIKVEEIEVPDRFGGSHSITLSYVDKRDPQTMATLTGRNQRRRFKTFEVDDRGTVLRMKMRSVE